MTFPVTFHRSRPSDRDLDALERIAGRRVEIEAVRPAGDRQAEVRGFLLSTLDRMEEHVCALGCGSAPVTDGWRCLSRFDSFGHGGTRDEPSNDS